ncbi:unnamed protein product [Rhizopus stolonifer]
MKVKKRQTDRKYSFEDQEATTNPKGYTHASKCVIKQKAVANIFKEVRQYWFQVNKLKTPVTLDAVTLKGLESLVIMESNLLLPSIPKASVKPLRRSLRTFSQKNPLCDKGVFADIHIPEGRYLMEIVGEIKLKSEYKTSNYFSLLGTPLRHVFFYHSLDAYMDSREFGNDARFIRRSCKPNSEIKSIILPNDNEDLLIHMGVYTIEELDKGEEVTIGWNWQRGLILHKKYQEFLKHKDEPEARKTLTDPEVRNTLKKSIRLLEAEYGECGCEDKDECFIEYIKDELEAESDSETPAEPIQVVKKKRPGRPRLSDSSKVVSTNSSDEEHKSRTKKRALSTDNDTPTKKPSTKGNIMSLKEAIMPPRMLFGKKRWLQIYLSQQKEKEKYVAAEDTPMEECNNYFSDASSESTLPLTDDTREVTSNNKPNTDDTNNNNTTEARTDANEVNTDNKEDNTNSKIEEVIELKKESKIEIAKEQPKQEKEPVKENTEELTTERSSSNKPTPRVKLSIQEYLSMRRNLPAN